MERAATAERHVLVQCAFDSLKRFAGAMIFRSTYVRSFDQYIARRITAEAFRAWRSVGRNRTDSKIMEVKPVAVQEVQDQSERIAELKSEVMRWQVLQTSAETQSRQSDLNHKSALRDNVKLRHEVQALIAKLALKREEVVDLEERNGYLDKDCCELRARIVCLKAKAGELSELSFDPERDKNQGEVPDKSSRFASEPSFDSSVARETASSSDGTEQKLDELQQLVRQLLQESTANVAEQVKNDALVDDNLHFTPTTVKKMLAGIDIKLDNITKGVENVNAQHGVMTALTVVNAMTPSTPERCAAASSATSSNPFDA